jgi:4-aminobutyrate aminotransferase-like enzyme/Ser/Thr protein kinase RdoA (MazF antagonist)
MLLETPVARHTTEEEAAQLARELYSIEAVAKALPGEYDENFQLTTPDGSGFVLKVMHPARERGFIDLQCRALEYLAERAPALSLPRVIPSRKGEGSTGVLSPDGLTRYVWLLSFIPGQTLAKVKPHTPELWSELGKFLGALDTALEGFTHPSAQRDLKWDLSRAEWIREQLHSIQQPPRRRLVEKFLAQYEAETQPALRKLRRSVIYGDANDYNVLVTSPWPQPRRIAGVIDFGDMHYGVTLSEPAIAAAYATLDKEDPLAAAAAVVSGYHSEHPFEEQEIALLYSLIGMRLAVSVTNSAQRKLVKPHDRYVTVSEEPAWQALDRWEQIHPRLAHYTFRAACALTPLPEAESITTWLGEHGRGAASILDLDLRNAPSLVFDLSAGSTFLGADPGSAAAGPLTEKIFSEMKRDGAAVGVGRYDEARLLYTSELFADGSNPTRERRTVHLGIDLFVEPGTPLRAPVAGSVHTLANNTAALDYGPMVILEHKIDHGGRFFTLYGHLATQTVEKLRVGQTISCGEEFATVGGVHENGGWVPHVHFQVILDLLELGKDFPGVARASERAVWTNLSPDPNLLLGIPADRFPAAANAEDTLTRRLKRLGKSLSLSYTRPLKIVRAWKQYLYDETGRTYLDVYNNVPLVGHSHPRVVRAAQQQLALLNTNTRYLHDNVNQYAERLTALLPEPLSVCYFVNSGSEANELALRLARAHTKREDVIVLEHAYHGHTSTLIDISPYKFNGPGGGGKKPWVHIAPLPDDYRGRYRREDPEAGKKYAEHVKQILDALRTAGRGAAAFIAETLPSVGGQIVFPRGYLGEAYRVCRAAGVVCIADEVQVGFGRLGTHFWGFQTQEVVPDIVVLGKPIGNGFPLAAVVTTRAIAETFANGMEFFSTFGGNPVACAAGLTVLDVLRDENLQENALKVGNQWIAALRDVQRSRPLIGDVRGSGLFLGLDLVKDPEKREPAPEHASYVVNRLRENGVLTGTDGPHHNVIKLRPPLVFSSADAELFVRTLEEVLNEDPAQP